MAHPARYKRRPTKATVEALLNEARALAPKVSALRDYVRGSKWADLEDSFDSFARLAGNDADGLVQWLALALKEAR